MSNREIYFDYVRTLAIITIICCHIGAEFILKNPKIFTDFELSYFVIFFSAAKFIGIPLFVMISGALLINKDYSLKTFIKKRFNRVFIPFIFWAIIYMIFSKLVMNRKLSFDNSIDIIFGTSGKIGVIFWFIWMILIVYIGILIINKILEYVKGRYPNFESKFINILTLSSLIVYILVSLGIITYSSKIIYYILFIPYAIFGYYLSNLDLENLNIKGKLKFNSQHIVVISLILSFLGYLFFIDNTVLNSMDAGKYIEADYFTIIVMVFTFSIFLFFKYFTNSEGKYFKRVYNSLYSERLKKIIYSISISSFGIYFVHYLVLKFLKYEFLQDLNFIHHPIFWTPILLVTVFFTSWFIVYILSKIPYVNKISGVK